MQNWTTVPVTTIAIQVNTSVHYFPPISVLLCGGISCCFSIFGAVVIFLSYCLVVNQKNKTRRLLMYMTIADLMTACGSLVGIIRYSVVHGINSDVNLNETVASDDICIVQSFMTSYSSLASFFWTLAISITLMLTVVFESDFCYKMKGTLLSHVLCWGSPLVLVMVAASFNVLGENLEKYHSLPWCWIKEGVEHEVFWMAFTGNIWQISAYLITAVIYILIKNFMRRKRNNDRYFGFRNISDRLRNEDENFAYVWLVLYVLRFWGTLRYFMSFIDPRSSAADSVLTHLQVIGNNAQAFSNCLLFVFFDKSMRRGMRNVFFRSSVGDPNERERLQPVV